MQSQVYREIEEVVNRMKRIGGIIGIMLFGSHSRGDYDEGSDIDLLAVFADKKSLDANVNGIYEATAKSDLFFQVIGLTLEELELSPLLESIRREGKIFFATEEVSKLLTPIHKPYALVTYSTANLKAKARVIFAQKLEGRRQNKYRYNGLIHKIGGYKVGRGVVMVPIENLRILTQHLHESKTSYLVRYVWA
nr:nucleotidyltransferase domain-containing protein [Candidatus Njordarchaeota archaeon]